MIVIGPRVCVANNRAYKTIAFDSKNEESQTDQNTGTASHAKHQIVKIYRNRTIIKPLGLVKETKA